VHRRDERPDRDEQYGADEPEERCTGCGRGIPHRVEGDCTRALSARLLVQPRSRLGRDAASGKSREYGTSSRAQSITSSDHAN
jgi:hypothetical protein